MSSHTNMKLYNLGRYRIYFYYDRHFCSVYFFFKFANQTPVPVSLSDLKRARGKQNWHFVNRNYDCLLLLVTNNISVALDALTYYCLPLLVLLLQLLQLLSLFLLCSSVLPVARTFGWFYNCCIWKEVAAILRSNNLNEIL